MSVAKSKEQKYLEWTLTAVRIYLAACGIAIIMLLTGLQNCNHDYYIFVRLAVFITGVWGACRATLSGKPIWAAVLAIMSCLFNPVFVIHLPRPIWIVVDLLVVLLLIWSAFVLSSKQAINYRESAA
jgi:hypothetical protein